MDAFEAGICAAMTEKAWQSHVLQIAAAYNWESYHTYDSRRSQPGWPDLALCRPPVLWLPELKTEHGRVRPEQRFWQDLLGQVTEVRVGIWRPSMRHDIVELLR